MDYLDCIMLAYERQITGIIAALNVIA